MQKITYRGYEIQPVDYQDTTCYRVPALEGDHLAVNLSAAKLWIDRAIAFGELPVL